MMKTRNTTSGGWAIGASALVLMSSAVVLPGCRGERSDEPPRQFIPDMDDGPKFKPQSETDFYADGRTMRPLVANAVAFGETSRPDAVGRAALLREAPDQYTGVDVSKPVGKDGVVSYVAYIPPSVLDTFIEFKQDRGVELDRPAALSAMVLRGQERFNIFCSACHGYNGEGGNPGAFIGGSVGRRWGYPVPSLHDAKYVDRSLPTAQDGYLFHVIRNGIADADPAKPNKMPSYREKVNEQDAWAIVSYVRVLQASWIEDPKDVPSQLRDKIPPAPPSSKSVSQAGTTSSEQPISQEARR